ncbi:MAG: RNA polymerase sigma-70 factor [Bacteroidales bacterium]|nr:RNA polymerase sigma-70 factor [Bacteroidales bacterium]
MESAISIRNLQLGNHKAYEELFKEFYAPLYKYAYSILRDADEAEDMVQKTFCKLYDKRSEIEIHTSIKSYLYRIVHNDCMNKIKQHSIRSEHNEHYAYEKNTLSNNAESTVLMNELEQQIEIAMNNMPPRCREVFTMSRRHHLSYAEIAKNLNISTNTVETQIVKALKLLRIGLKEYLT